MISDTVKGLSLLFLGMLFLVLILIFLFGLIPLTNYSYKILNQNNYQQAILYVDSLEFKSASYRRHESVLIAYGRINQIYKVRYFLGSKHEITKENTIPIWYIHYKSRYSILYRPPEERNFKDKVPAYKEKMLHVFLKFNVPLLIFCLLYIFFKKYNHE